MPEVVPYRADPSMLVPLAANFPVSQTKLYYAANAQTTYRPLQDLMMFIDPAGGGEDELGYAVTGALGPYIHLLTMGGLRGGFKAENIKRILQTLFDYKIKYVRAGTQHGPRSVRDELAW